MNDYTTGTDTGATSPVTGPTDSLGPSPSTSAPGFTLAEWATRATIALNTAKSLGHDTITYGELAAAIGYPFALWHRHFAQVLNIVALDDLELTRMVVRKDTGAPGNGYPIAKRSA